MPRSTPGDILSRQEHPAYWRMPAVARVRKHKWAFSQRFRARAFGWKSQLPVKRVKEAVAEIQRVARTDPVLGAEGAILFLEKVSAAIENVDSSSGSMGNAVNRAIEALVPIIAAAPVSDEVRGGWLDRLWDAIESDLIPYLENLQEFWGELCASPDHIARWTFRLLPGLRESWASGKRGEYYRGTPACLSCLLVGKRYEELLALLGKAPFVFWPQRQYGVRALAEMGRVDEAIEYAEKSVGLNDPRCLMEQACERILLDAGRVDEAYARYGISANLGTSNLATFRAIAKKYPDKAPTEIFDDLLKRSPGSEGKWFATAKSLKLYDLAGKLAWASPCDPKTLNRAARDHIESQPEFARDVAIASLHWLARGHGFEITARDVYTAYHYAMNAAEVCGSTKDTRSRIREIVEGDSSPGMFVRQVLGREFGLSESG
jgi:tetratricopeptide (TPR) repeat protein